MWDNRVFALAAAALTIGPVIAPGTLFAATYTSPSLKISTTASAGPTVIPAEEPAPSAKRSSQPTGALKPTLSVCSAEPIR